MLKVLRRDDASPRALGRLHHEHEVARALDAPVIVKTHAILPLHPAETETDTDGRSAELPQA